MKKIFCIIIAVAMCFSLCACETAEEKAVESVDGTYWCYAMGDGTNGLGIYWLYEFYEVEDLGGSVKRTSYVMQDGEITSYYEYEGYFHVLDKSDSNYIYITYSYLESESSGQENEENTVKLETLEYETDDNGAICEIYTCDDTTSERDKQLTRLTDLETN